MKNLIVLICSAAFGRNHLVSVANDVEEHIAIANGAGGEAIFDVQQEERLFVPYGEYQHARGLQKFDRTAAEKMVNAFNSIGSKFMRWITKASVPIYRGHPDVPGRPDSDPSAPAVGWVIGITAENDGMAMEVKWGEDGERSIRNGQYRFYSPHWNCGRVSGGIQPVELLSVGLTNNPRIPVPAIANDATEVKINPELLSIFGLAETATLVDLMEAVQKEWCRVSCYNELLSYLGVDREAATEELILAAAKALKEKAGKLTKAENDLGDLRGQLTAANSALSASRKAGIEARLDVLVAERKLTAAERGVQAGKLIAIENDAEIETAFAELGKGKLPSNPAPVSKDLGKRNSETLKAHNDRQTAIRDAVAEQIKAVANDFPTMSETARYEMAFDRARKANATLFANA